MKRGRKSTASLTVIQPITDARPQPPGDLTPAQSELWTSIVRRLRGDWFPRETLALLKAHVRHATTAELLSKSIDAYEPSWLAVDGGPERLDRLTKLRDREVRGLLATARALRLTKQAQIRPEAAGRQARDASMSGRRPWDYPRKEVTDV